MAYNTKRMLRDADQKYIPQYYDPIEDVFKPLTDPTKVKVEHSLAEQKTHTDAVGGVLTFAANLKHVEIYNTDSTNTGVFTINGIDIHVPPSTPFEANIGGTPGNTATVTGATSYIVSRYV